MTNAVQIIIAAFVACGVYFVVTKLGLDRDTLLWTCSGMGGFAAYLVIQ